MHWYARIDLKKIFDFNFQKVIRLYLFLFQPSDMYQFAKI